MKGIVFTELIDMIDKRFGEAVLENTLTDAALVHGGAYTSVGSYPAEELIQIVAALSKRVDTPVPELVITFGVYLFGRFTQLYSGFFQGSLDLFNFLELVDSYIHVEVRKLYPDAELPSFETSRPDPRTLHMIYRSRHNFATLAEGLLLGAIAYFGEKVSLSQTPLDEAPLTAVRFTLQRDA
jgi:hypothetical protein